MLNQTTKGTFDKIYSSDLVYIKDCWKLCGNAHCCGFFPYKENFKIVGQTKFHELPLLPGEYEFLRHKGWWDQFGDVEHKVQEFQIGNRSLKIETMYSRKPMCACEHDTRLTVCRLYPLLPQFDIGGKLTSVRTFGIFEELEKVEKLEPACKITALPFSQMQAFLVITNEIAKSPEILFYFAAYAMTVDHVRTRIDHYKDIKGEAANAFSIFEEMYLFGKLADPKVLTPQLIALAEQFETKYGSDFLKN